MSITKAINMAVLITKFFLSITANLISFASSITAMYPTLFSSIEIFLTVIKKNWLFKSWLNVKG